MTTQPHPTDLVNERGATWAENFDAYASGQISAAQLKCVLCQTAPCSCTECPTHHLNTRSRGC